MYEEDVRTGYANPFASRVSAIDDRKVSDVSPEKTFNSFSHASLSFLIRRKRRRGHETMSTIFMCLLLYKRTPPELKEKKKKGSIIDVIFGIWFKNLNTVKPRDKHSPYHWRCNVRRDF